MKDYYSKQQIIDILYEIHEAIVYNKPEIIGHIIYRLQTELEEQVNQCKVTGHDNTKIQTQIQKNR